MFSEIEVQELKAVVTGEIYSVEEAGVKYFFIPSFPIEVASGTSLQVDLLLCPAPRDGYPSRLFFSHVVPTRTPRNWNTQNVRIADRNWFAFSWMLNGKPLRLAEVFLCHLQGVR